MGPRLRGDDSRVIGLDFVLDIRTETKWPGASPAITCSASWSAARLRLLDRGEQPMAAAHAHEGPDFGGLVGPALGHAAALAIDGLIVE
jgi:hypothetical protein